MKRRLFLILLPLLFALLSCGSLRVEEAPAQNASYTEPHRPQFHFSPPTMWMNDPNGLVYNAGEYHLFYQYHPESNVWGPMHWGHAVSPDMVHWQHLPIALYPDELGYIFSGSAVVDHDNRSGFQTGDEPPMVAIYTYHDPVAREAGRQDYQSQGIAYSLDRGRTWTKYADNPVIANPGLEDFRDPKVVWDEDSKQWVMVLAAHDQVMLWGSPDLKNWSHLSDFGKEWGAHGGVWECPDLFPITVEGTGEKKWVLIQSLNPGGPNGGSGTQYFVGDFDGTSFHLDPAFAASVADQQAVWLDYGSDDYAGVTWSNIPKEDGRRLFLGWMSNWDYAQKVPTTVWRSAMTIPRELVLRKTGQDYRIITRPARELDSLRGAPAAIESMDISGVVDVTGKLPHFDGLAELTLDLKLPDDAAGIVGIELSNSRGETYRIGFDAAKKQFFSDRRNAGDASFSDAFAANVHTAPRLSEDGTLCLHLFLDVSSAELFADDGASVMTEIFFPTEPFTRIGMFSEGKGFRVLSGEIFPLSSAWN